MAAHDETYMYVPAHTTRQESFLLYISMYCNLYMEKKSTIIVQNKFLTAMLPCNRNDDGYTSDMIHHHQYCCPLPLWSILLYGKCKQDAQQILYHMAAMVVVLVVVVICFVLFWSKIKTINIKQALWIDVPMPTTVIHQYQYW